MQYSNNKSTASNWSMRKCRSKSSWKQRWRKRQKRRRVQKRRRKSKPRLSQRNWQICSCRQKQRRKKKNCLRLPSSSCGRLRNSRSNSSNPRRSWNRWVRRTKLKWGWCSNSSSWQMRSWMKLVQLYSTARLHRTWWTSLQISWQDNRALPASNSSRVACWKPWRSSWPNRRVKHSSSYKSRSSRRRTKRWSTLRRLPSLQPRSRLIKKSPRKMQSASSWDWKCLPTSCAMKKQTNFPSGSSSTSVTKFFQRRKISFSTNRILTDHKTPSRLSDSWTSM